MKTILAAASAAALLLSPLPTLADEQGEEAQVMAVVDAFMAGLAAKDAEAMTALVTEDGYLALVRPMEDGDRTQSMLLTDAAGGIASIPSDIAEPTWDEVVMVEGPVAMVWAPYAFLVDGERSHCGIDIFTLMRVDGEWKIATVTYSHIEDQCPDMPV
ncbi:nuclear transport factor 2 family protein [Aurantiacibacter gilvus]|uniref:Nuclear transport factor 2 family protein n=1 Tax=Aurantiacibacter gilvus TaxID=3139141 RepID=A0ABU9IFR5_9SPHN